MSNKTIMWLAIAIGIWIVWSRTIGVIETPQTAGLTNGSDLD